MADLMNKPMIRIELTAEQKEQLRQATGKAVPAVKLQLEELETRIAPGRRIN